MPAPGLPALFDNPPLVLPAVVGAPPELAPPVGVDGDESFEVDEGEAAAYTATLPHWVEPSSPVEPGVQPPKILQIVLP